MTVIRPLRANESQAAAAFVPPLDFDSASKVLRALEAACDAAYKNGIADERARLELMREITDQTDRKAS